MFYEGGDRDKSGSQFLSLKKKSKIPILPEDKLNLQGDDQDPVIGKKSQISKVKQERRKSKTIRHIAMGNGLLQLPGQESPENLIEIEDEDEVAMNLSNNIDLYLKEKMNKDNEVAEVARMENHEKAFHFLDKIIDEFLDISNIDFDLENETSAELLLARYLRFIEKGNF